jgi:cytochrome c
MRVRTLIWGAVLVFGVSVSSSFIHPYGDLRAGAGKGDSLLAGTTVPAIVRNVLLTKCADCHSSNTHWPLYSRMAPASWLMEYDVAEARSHLNLSQWRQYSTENQIELLARMASQARSGQMPPRQYLLLHPKTRLTAEEQDLLYGWAKSERKQLKQSLLNQQSRASSK